MCALMLKRSGVVVEPGGRVLHDSSRKAPEIPADKPISWFDAVYDQIYITVKGGHMARLVQKHAAIHDGKVYDRPGKAIFEFWAPDLREWLRVEDFMDQLVHTDIDLLNAASKAVRPSLNALGLPTKPKSNHPGNVANLKPRAKREAPEVAPEDGKRAFVGKLGGVRVLMDAGNGQVIGSGDVKTIATQHNRVLVTRAEVTQYASYVYQEAWEAERRK